VARAPRILLALLALAVVAGAVVLWHPWPRRGADRLKHMVSWPGDCRAIETYTASSRSQLGWRHATTTATVVCENLGPSVGYARWPDATTMTTDLHRRPPQHAFCLYGDHELALDALEPGQFADLCDELGGRLRR
jgi:hypothetical protein